jgi:hypothetical protein
MQESVCTRCAFSLPLLLSVSGRDDIAAPSHFSRAAQQCTNLPAFHLGILNCIFPRNERQYAERARERELTGVINYQEPFYLHEHMLMQNHDLPRNIFHTHIDVCSFASLCSRCTSGRKLINRHFL